jgi:hypothetical protein
MALWRFSVFLIANTNELPRHFVRGQYPGAAHRRALHDDTRLVRTRVRALRALRANPDPQAATSAFHRNPHDEPVFINARRLVRSPRESSGRGC